MKLLNLHFLFIIFIISVTSGYSQQGNLEVTKGVNDRVIDYQLVTEEKTEFEGSPYLNDEWIEGQLIFIDGNIIDVPFINYNVYNKSVVFKKGEATFSPIYKVELDKLKIGEKIYILNRNKHGDFDIRELLFNGEKISLMKEYECKYLKGKPSNGIIPETKDKFLLSHRYIVKLAGNEEMEIKGRDKEIVKLMQDKKDVIKNFLEDKNINGKDESDLLQVIMYIDSLN